MRIMARTPEVDAAIWARLVQATADAGYDLGELRRVPQQWDGGSTPECDESYPNPFCQLSQT